jgi:hypothetical protein
MDYEKQAVMKMNEGADYHVKVLPTENKTWQQADKLQFVLTLKMDGEDRIFKGIADMTGIIKKVKA